MNPPTSLTLRGATLPDPSEWKTLLEMADVFIKSGLLPSAIKTPQAAIVVMLKGRELGIPSLYALSNIAVIQGKPAASAELMLALIYRDHGDDALRFVETTSAKCTASYKRRGWSSRETYSFTIQDAATAGLAQSDTWRKYPMALLRARCISAVARMAFPDTIGGLYTPEELGASVTVTDADDPTIHVPQTVIANPTTGEILDAEEAPALTAPAREQGAPARIAGEIRRERHPTHPIAAAADPWDEPSPIRTPPDRAELESIQAREIAEMGQHPQPATNGDKASPSQIRYIYTIARTTRNLSDAQVEAMAKAQFKLLPDQLSKRQASEFITALKAGEAAVK